MNGLHSILRRTHCRNTHHLFAIDALTLVQTDAGKRLAGWLLRYHHRYLKGALDPDIRFRDFQNHIIHVEDGYWGGAPRVAHQWYDRLQRYLRNGRYGDAAHAAGVLSHYFTDPMQPLHTGHTKREALVHRPLEWSIYQSYDAIYRIWIEDDLRIVFQLSDQPGWLASAMLHAARYSHNKYELLVNSYRFDEGVEDPPAGLDWQSRAALAELFGLAITGWARVIERAASDAEAVMRRPLPRASATWPIVTATLRIPSRWWRRRVNVCEEAMAIASLVDEYRRTGRLVDHLPDEVDIKQRVIQVYQNEKLYKLDRQRRAAEKRLAAQQRPTTKDDAPATISLAPRDLRVTRLSPTDRLVDAPSIGEKTAARLNRIGVHNVAQFLASNYEDLAQRLEIYWITPALVALWQAQATLKSQVPDLRDIDAQLLAGAGFHSAAQVAASDPRLLHSEVCRYALTTAGRRYLSGQAPPSVNKAQQWVHDAKQITAQSRPAQSRPAQSRSAQSRSA